MPNEFVFTPKFKLIVDRLKAVRTLDEYVNGAGLKKDMQDFANYLKRDLSPGILRPAGWKNLDTRKDCLYSSPLGEQPAERPTTKVVRRRGRCHRD